MNRALKCGGGLTYRFFSCGNGYPLQFLTLTTSQNYSMALPCVGSIPSLSGGLGWQSERSKEL